MPPPRAAASQLQRAAASQLQRRHQRNSKASAVTQILDFSAIRRHWNSLSLDARVRCLRFEDPLLVQRAYANQQTLQHNEVLCFYFGIRRYDKAGSTVLRVGLDEFDFVLSTESRTTGSEPEGSVGSCSLCAKREFVDSASFLDVLEEHLGGSLLAGCAAALPRADWASIFEPTPNSWHEYEQQCLRLVGLAIIQSYQDARQKATLAALADKEEENSTADLCEARPSPAKHSSRKRAARKKQQSQPSPVPCGGSTSAGRHDDLGGEAGDELAEDHKEQECRPPTRGADLIKDEAPAADLETNRQETEADKHEADQECQPGLPEEEARHEEPEDEAEEEGVDEEEREEEDVELEVQMETQQAAREAKETTPAAVPAAAARSTAQACEQARAALDADWHLHPAVQGSSEDGEERWTTVSRRRAKGTRPAAPADTTPAQALPLPPRLERTGSLEAGPSGPCGLHGDEAFLDGLLPGCEEPPLEVTSTADPTDSSVGSSSDSVTNSPRGEGNPAQAVPEETDFGLEFRVTVKWTFIQVECFPTAEPNTRRRARSLDSHLRNSK